MNKRIHGFLLILFAFCFASFHISKHVSRRIFANIVVTKNIDIETSQGPKALSLT